MTKAEIQETADKLYAHKRINAYSGASQNTAEDLAELCPELSNDEIDDFVFEATINFQERD